MKNDEARPSPEAAREEFFPGVWSEASTEASDCPRVGTQADLKVRLYIVRGAEDRSGPPEGGPHDL